MTYCGPSSSISSSRFISCVSEYAGGGMYHDSNTTTSTLTLSDSLFTNNCANYKFDFQKTHRGGGAFEDYRQRSYISTYSFSFFSGNRATYDVGNDISIHINALLLNNILHCMTTTSSSSFWNVDDHIDNWLPLTKINSELLELLAAANEICTKRTVPDSR